VAAVWARDSRPRKWLAETDVEQLIARDVALRREGFLPVDVSVAQRAGSAPWYAAVWEKADEADTEARLVTGLLSEQVQRESAVLVQEKFNCLTASVLPGDGRTYGASLWIRRKGQQKSTTRVFHGPADDFREDDCPGLLVSDARINHVESQDDSETGSFLSTTVLWNVSTHFESKLLHSLSPVEQLRHGLQLTADGFRPVAISASGSPSGSLVTTSVWHRPLVPEKVKDRLARRQATAAVILLRLKHDQRIWPLLRQRPDPRTRSYLIHQFSPLGADPQEILSQFDAQEDVSIRRALILTLGEFNEQQLPPAERDRLTPRLLDSYANDPDSGMHGALAWTLRQWNRHAELQNVNRKFATGLAAGNRRWFVNRQGQTLAIIPPPGGIVIGSPPSEAGREEGPEGDVEIQRSVRIDHSFAIMPCTVTVAEFLRFRKDFYYRETFSAELNCPINNLNWYEAAAYCNWLNEQEEIPQEEWCYLPNDSGEYAQGMTIVPNCLRRTGYRLPTEAEWEHACRAGSITSRYYGQSPDLDNHYAWTVKLALGRGTTSVGRFKPNDFGMFDMMGNIMEWIHDASLDLQHTAASQLVEDLGKPEVVSNLRMRAVRPSCYTSTGAERTRSAAREIRVPPNARILLHALRVSRTFAAGDSTDRHTQVTDDQRRMLMGAPVMHSSGFIRSSYRSMGYSPNFGLFAWGLRPARTIS
jgi:formylglycine-generating enzyme required for sulfatase activity